MLMQENKSHLYGEGGWKLEDTGERFFHFGSHSSTVYSKINILRGEKNILKTQSISSSLNTDLLNLLYSSCCKFKSFCWNLA